MNSRSTRLNVIAHSWSACLALVCALAGTLMHSEGMPVRTVAQHGMADFHTLQGALYEAPVSGEIIRIAPGWYREKLHIQTPNIFLVGTGKRPEDVVLSWNDSALTAGGTGKSGSVSVDADGFEAENLTIENTWEREHKRTQEGSQAVALLLNSDRAVIDHVRLLGAQDTLYANSRTCHASLPKDGSAAPVNTPDCAASRQFFSHCYVAGHVDFIFGDAKAVFDHCELHARHNPTVMLTAQSRHFPEEESGYYFLHCKITGDSSKDNVVLGRPWRDDSTVIFYDTDVEQKLNAVGWSDWDGRLKTSTYREYKSHGPGVNGGHRIISYPGLTRVEEKRLTPDDLLAGADGWNPVAAAKRLRELH